jgi:hypothetical protein
MGRNWFKIILRINNVNPGGNDTKEKRKYSYNVTQIYLMSVQLWTSTFRCARRWSNVDTAAIPQGVLYSIKWLFQNKLKTKFLYQVRQQQPTTRIKSIFTAQLHLMAGLIKIITQSVNVC